MSMLLAAAADAANAAQAAAPIVPDFAQKALVFAAAFSSIGFAAIGSAYGAGAAACAAVGAWKKCYAQNKPAPFQLLIFAGAPLSQTIYGMIMMILISGAAAKTPGMWPLYLAVGVFGGLAQMFSALFQGRAAAGGCNSFAETNQGFANDLMILGVVETCAIFALVFSIMVMA